jgi:methylphosphotriester-DNA--protein-cysteine methyltransferase
MRKVFALLLVLSILLPLVSAADPTHIIANSKTKVYHDGKCHPQTEIKSSNLVKFSSVSQAIAAGYHPCKKCTH